MYLGFLLESLGLLDSVGAGVDELKVISVRIHFPNSYSKYKFALWSRAAAAFVSSYIVQWDFFLSLLVFVSESL